MKGPLELQWPDDWRWYHRMGFYIVMVPVAIFYSLIVFPYEDWQIKRSFERAKKRSR